MNDVDAIVANLISPSAEIGEEIRCENWAANPGLCGADCHLVLPPWTAVEGISLAQWIHSRGWFTLEHGCVREALHQVKPFCTLACLLDWLHREHPDAVNSWTRSAWLRLQAKMGGGE